MVRHSGWAVSCTPEDALAHGQLQPRQLPSLCLELHTWCRGNSLQEERFHAGGGGGRALRAQRPRGNVTLNRWELQRNQRLPRHHFVMQIEQEGENHPLKGSASLPQELERGAPAERQNLAAGPGARKGVAETAPASPLAHTEGAWHRGSVSGCSSVPLSNTGTRVDKFPREARPGACPPAAAARGRGLSKAQPAAPWKTAGSLSLGLCSLRAQGSSQLQGCTSDSAASSSPISTQAAQLGPNQALAQGPQSQLRGSCSSCPFPDHTKWVFVGLRQPLGSVCVLQH